MADINLLEVMLQIREIETKKIDTPEKVLEYISTSKTKLSKNYLKTI